MPSIYQIGKLKKLQI